MSRPDTETLSHTRWDYKYHVVFTPAPLPLLCKPQEQGERKKDVTLMSEGLERHTAARRIFAETAPYSDKSMEDLGLGLDHMQEGEA